MRKSNITHCYQIRNIAPIDKKTLERLGTLTNNLD